MQTLHIKAEDSVIQKILASLNILVEAGNNIEVEFVGSASPSQEGSWDDILQNEQLMQDLRESIAQIERGELFSADEAFKKVYEELGL